MSATWRLAQRLDFRNRNELCRLRFRYFDLCAPLLVKPSHTSARPGLFLRFSSMPWNPKLRTENLAISQLLWYQDPSLQLSGQKNAPRVSTRFAYADARRAVHCREDTDPESPPHHQRTLQATELVETKLQHHVHVWRGHLFFSDLFSHDNANRGQMFHRGPILYSVLAFPWLRKHSVASPW